MSNQSILSEHNGIKIDERFVLKFIKAGKNVNKESKNSCKVLQFTSEWNFEEVLAVISELESKEYPQLFIFVIESSNRDEYSTKLQEILIMFGSNRPIILQILLSETKSNLYLKCDFSNVFVTINNQPYNLEDIKSFTKFLNLFIQNKFENFEECILGILPKLQNRSLVRKFILTLNLSAPFFKSIILEIASNGTKAELLSALDVSLERSGNAPFNEKAQMFISDVFEDDDDAGDDNSVLLTAVNNKNTEIIYYLITYCSHLLQQLPFDHQVMISTAAFKTDQFDILCDLLDNADFPFPQNFKSYSIVHEKLSKLIQERLKFQEAINSENLKDIKRFNNSKVNLKLVYDYSNKSAMTVARNQNKLKVIFYLKSLGFQGENCDEILNELSKTDKKHALVYRMKRRNKNIRKSLPNVHRSVLKLSLQSSIHNKRIAKEQADKYHQTIIKWFKDIHKVVPLLIDIAASCDDLKIIFDFEDYSVESVSLTGSDAAGSTYPINKWIFVSAKLTDENEEINKKHEQKIKGVIAHELCHYVMRLVYNNDEKPYYRHRKDIKNIFEKIVKQIDKWSSGDSGYPDDKCNGIISSVFTLYNYEDFHPELIVRVVQILMEFDDSKDQLQCLHYEYKILFAFWYAFVENDLLKFNKKHEDDIRKLNETFGLVKSIENRNLKLRLLPNLKILQNSDFVIMTTNIPKLLIISICDYFRENCDNQLDTYNLLVDPIKLEERNVFSEFKILVSEIPNVNIIVDCSKEINWNNFKISEKSKLIFIVSNKTEMKTIKVKDRENPVNENIVYDWNHFTIESQISLLQTNVVFQNNPETLLNLLMNNFGEKETSINDALKTFSDIVDDDIFNNLIDKIEISINTHKKNDSSEKNFKLFFKLRQFVKKQYNFPILRRTSTDQIKRENQPNNKVNISQVDLLKEVKQKKYVLISDYAGNGKSWAMNNFTKILLEQNKTNWVTYVDLKQFINEFRLNMRRQSAPEFSSFIANQILKPQQQFEARIFKKIYKNGKVFILFDGFDEIAPDCAEFVSRLAQDFQSNGGNQLWIATRDYFEVDLMLKLHLNVAYSLGEMTADEEVDLIAKSWALKDIKDNSKYASRQEFDEEVEK